MAFHFLAVRTVVGENILEVLFSCLHGGSRKYFGGFLAVRLLVGGNILDIRILEKVTNHFFEKSLQTSRDSFGWGYNSNKSWDVRLDSPKSGVSFFSCPHGGRGKYLGGLFSCLHGGRGKYFRGFC